MTKFLCKLTEEYCFYSEKDVDDFEAEVKQDANNNGYLISDFNKSHKVTKNDEYYTAKVVRIINKAANPQLPFIGVELQRGGENALPWDEKESAY